MSRKLDLEPTSGSKSAAFFIPLGFGFLGLLIATCNDVVQTAKSDAMTARALATPTPSHWPDRRLTSSRRPTATPIIVNGLECRPVATPEPETTSFGDDDDDFMDYSDLERMTSPMVPRPFRHPLNPHGGGWMP